VVETPIVLTNTLNVGLVADALVQYMIRHNPDIGITTSTTNVIVGETHDGYLNDIQGRHVRAEHVWAAIESAAPGPVVEGQWERARGPVVSAGRAASGQPAG